MNASGEVAAEVVCGGLHPAARYMQLDGVNLVVLHSGSGLQVPRADHINGKPYIHDVSDVVPIS